MADKEVRGQRGCQSSCAKRIIKGSNGSLAKGNQPVALQIRGHKGAKRVIQASFSEGVIKGGAIKDESKDRSERTNDRAVQAQPVIPAGMTILAGLQAPGVTLEGYSHF
jgi:hypothetical protein